MRVKDIAGARRRLERSARACGQVEVAVRSVARPVDVSTMAVRPAQGTAYEAENQVERRRVDVIYAPRRASIAIERKAASAQPGERFSVITHRGNQLAIIGLVSEMRSASDRLMRGGPELITVLVVFAMARSIAGMDRRARRRPEGGTCERRRV